MKKMTESQRVAAQRSQDLQLTLLAELKEGPRTVRQLVIKFDRTRKSIYDALEKLYDAFMVDSITDMRTGADGLVIGTTWTLAGCAQLSIEEHDWRAREAMQKPKVLPIPRDPWIWALHGAQP